MDFTKDEAATKVGKKVCVKVNSFSVPKGTMGQVKGAQSLGSVGVGPGQVMNPMKESWALSIKFNNPVEILVDKDEYNSCLQELP